MERIGAPLVAIRWAAILLASFCLVAAVRSGQTAYVGGTAAVPRNALGVLNVNDEGKAVFQYRSGKFAIPYSSITSLEFEAKPETKASFFSRKQRLLLTIGFGEGSSQREAVFELASETARATLEILEARSGKRVEMDPGNSEFVPHAPLLQPVAAFTPLVDVTFYSTPTGATVSMYGRTIGCTPFITRLEPGAYKATFSAAGHVDVTQQVTVKPYKPSMVRVDLGSE